MRRCSFIPFGAGIALALLVAMPGHAQHRAALERCGDPNETPARAARFCAEALEGNLTQRQRALVALNLGLARLALDNPRAALPAFDVALAADPREARALAGRARAHMALRDVPRAAVDWNRAVALAPREADIVSGRGAFRLRAGNADGALADFETAARLAPADPAHDFNRGMALAELGRDAEAVRAFSQVIAADPDDAEAWLNRARVRAESGPDSALSDFSRAIALRPEWGLAFFERGLLHNAQGRTVQADEDFRRAWELGHRNEYLEQRIRELGG
jgi:tetratricopeptide (TPR) repeat protein